MWTYLGGGGWFSFHKGERERERCIGISSLVIKMCPYKGKNVEFGQGGSKKGKGGGKERRGGTVVVQ
jgi:hypothetical protein